MKIVISAAILLSIVPGIALAGSAYDACIKEEKALKAQESGDCSGIRYLLNPSGCFSTRKALKEYAAGKCKNIGLSENVDFSIPSAAPAITRVTASPMEAAAEKKPALAIKAPDTMIDRLTAENDRLRSENERLKNENEQLKKSGH